MPFERERAVANSGATCYYQVMSVFVTRNNVLYPGIVAFGPVSVQAGGDPRTGTIAVYGRRKTSTHIAVDAAPYLAASAGQGAGGMFVFRVAASGTARDAGLAASSEDAERLGHYLLAVCEALTGAAQPRHNTATLAAHASAAPAYPVSQLSCALAAPLTATAQYRAAGLVPPFALASVIVPSYGCHFELPHRRGFPNLEERWHDWGDVCLRGYARGGGNDQPVYVLAFGSANLGGRGARLFAEFAMPLADLADFAHALLDAVSEYTGRATDR